MAQVKGSPSWSDLPLELLGLVFLRLPTRADRASFPAVCRTWCSSVQQCRLPPPSPVPWLLLPDGSATSFPHRETFQLPNGMRYLNTSGEWLLLSRNDGSCFLMNHFTKATMPLPSLSSYRYYEVPVKKVPEDHIPHYYRMQGDSWLDIKDSGSIYVSSLVVCSTRLVAAIVAVGPLGAIALRRPGAAAWSVSARRKCRWLSRMVFFQGKLYALNHRGNSDDLIAIDIVDEHDSDEPRVSRVERVIKGVSLSSCLGHYICTHYLLESNGILLMVRRRFSNKSQDWSDVVRSTKFEVFEADIEEHLWAEVRTLGNDQALFLGQGSSRAVHVSPDDLSRNCIFFLDDFTNMLMEETTKSCQVYDMKDEKMYSPLPMVSWVERVPATWIFSLGGTDESANSRGGSSGT